MQDTEEEFLKKKNNIRLFPFYKMIASDLLFFYAISFLFLLYAKDLKVYQILYLDSLFVIFKIIFQIPSLLILEKVNKKNSIILGNISLFMFVFLLIISNNFPMLILAHLFAALGFSLNAIAEQNILLDSVVAKTGKKTFSSVYSKGLSLHAYADAVSSIIAGYLFVINPYLPMYLCLFLCIISIYISTKFEEIKPISKNSHKSIQFYFKDLLHSAKFIFKSKRLSSFLLYDFIFMGVLSLMNTYNKSLLNTLGVSAKYFGIIFAVFAILQGFSISKQNKIHSLFKNKTLSFIAFSFLFTCILIPLILILKINTTTIYIVIFILSIQYMIKGPYTVLSKKYLKNFSTPNLRPKISMINELVESLGRALLSLLGGIMLQFCNIIGAILFVGMFFSVIMILILNYMKDRAGLNPDEYKKKDIVYESLK